MSLPIDDIRPDFERALAGCKRLVVTAETGAGKSTRLPVWLADLVGGLILVVEPRRIACHALAEFLASERGESVGSYFGSRVRFSDRSGPDTRVLFCTPGVALRMLAGPLQLGALVVDEFHERSWQVDLVVAAAASLPAFRDVPLVLTSATIDVEPALATLGATTLHATGRTHPVAVRYESGSIEPSTESLGERLADAVTTALHEHEGDVLAFLPGIREIRSAERALGRRAEEVLVVHGSQPPEAMQRVFAKPSRRRIYLATNVAETSLTLPGVRIVIDSGLAKTKLHRAGRAVLATTPISDASMQQRAGRAGRVAPGVCIRLWSERFLPDAYQRPEIERVELDDLLLQAAELGLAEKSFDQAAWITPPPAFAVERARQRLRDLDALDGDALTTRGRSLAQLPVSAEEAALLVGAPPHLAATLCDLVAILQARGSLLREVSDLPRADQEAVVDARIELLQGLGDEVTTGLRLLREGSIKRHHLSRRRVDEARTIARQLRDLTDARGESLDGLAEYIATRLPAAGFVLRPRASRERARGRSMPWANGSIEVQVHAFTPYDPAVEPPKHRAAVILETDWVASAKGVVGIGRMVLPASTAALANAGLGEAAIAGVRLEKKSRGRFVVWAERTVQLAGVTLATEDVELRGRDLHRAVAELVFENRLFRGAGDAVRDALHGWRVLSEWRGEPLEAHGEVAGPQPAEDLDWLIQRMETLGLETCSELSLIEGEDLVPNLERETGVPDWEAEQLLKDFPRVWSHQGGLYSCSVSPAARRVHLRPLDGKARKLKEPLVGSLPRFRGFGVTFHQGSRRVSLR